MDDPNPAPRRPRRLRRWIAPLVVCGVLAIAAAWYFRGRTVWTDGRGTRLAADDAAALREVLWSIPERLDLPGVASGAAADEQQYEPALSPDGTELYFVRGKPGGGHAHIYVSHRKDN